jgi:hypothetical protein
MLFFIFFITVSLSLFFLLVIPSYKDLKFSVIKGSKITKELKVTKEQEQNYIKMQKELLQTNQSIVNAFSNEYSQKEFEKNLKQYFDDVDIKLVGSLVYNKIFIKKILKISTTIQTPTNLYNFFKSLDTSRYITEINYPINFRKVNNKIAVEFNLAIYQYIKPKQERKIDESCMSSLSCGQ